MASISISVGIGIVLFLCFLFGYREGLRLGMQSAKGIVPKPIKSPASAVKDLVAEVGAQQKAKEVASQYAAFEAFDGYTDEERAMINRNGG